MSKDTVPQLSIRFCGSDCNGCQTYQRFLVGDESGVVNADTQYRCCWLPVDYPRGRDCEFRTCCQEQGLQFCAECAQFETCARARQFYSQPGYERLRERMFEALEARRHTRG
jgi:hypothetical protein